MGTFDLDRVAKRKQQEAEEQSRKEAGLQYYEQQRLEWQKYVDDRLDDYLRRAHSSTAKLQTIEIIAETGLFPNVLKIQTVQAYPFHNEDGFGIPFRYSLPPELKQKNPFSLIEPYVQKYRNAYISPDGQTYLSCRINYSYKPKFKFIHCKKHSLGEIYVRVDRQDAVRYLAALNWADFVGSAFGGAPPRETIDEAVIKMKESLRKDLESFL